ncbi:tartrate dehydrogenase [Ignatzschineria indica]|uniref:D-malate dehydrogenase (decarboxylating) n=1 Tax=Ignatzschineria indica TaxID=472583 RepID=A0A2U2AP59_9GAMM|nr:tartrate dehydrogenase [Ignatzschineria indica]PWD85000.1 tartrate dehydrogenase [Ignatzschineria indica]GGZ80743.1 tartrate dehydrogenase [Ignatzschineria indica]
MVKRFKVAVLAGDGIGKEVMPEGLKVLKSVIQKYHLNITFEVFDWANCDYYAENGTMMPADWFETLSSFDAIYYGAVGWPELVPDHISLWGSLLQFRRRFDQYVNLRPVRLFPGVTSPLAGKKPGDIDFYVIRENTEGEYSAIGGKVYEGTEHEFVLQESVFSKRGVDRILRYAFEFAQKRERKILTSATKSNGLAISMPYWDERVEDIAKEYPDIQWDKQHIDILCARFVMRPEQFDVVVASNLFGDILSDLGPACTGTMGLAPSANINPERTYPSLFEPVHGSAPDIYGKNIANPIAMIWSGAMMLNFFGELEGCESYREAHDHILHAIEKVLAEGPYTKDMGGAETTEAMGDAIVKLIEAR